MLTIEKKVLIYFIEFTDMWTIELIYLMNVWTPFHFNQSIQFLNIINFRHDIIHELDELLINYPNIIDQSITNSVLEFL
jgi:hypothetical protein